jgi:hypothetical protein
MKRALNVAAVLMFAAFVSLSAEGRHNSGFTIELTGSHDSIHSDSAVWRVGEPVRVIVVMNNQSKRAVAFSLTNPGLDWEMDVRDAEGKPVAETDLFRRMKENVKSGQIITGRSMFGTLPPNQKAQDVIEVQGFYDLSRPGEYSIQVQRVFPDVANDPIKSNRLTLAITP